MSDEEIINEFTEHLQQKEFPCIGAKASMAKGLMKCMVASHMACPHNDKDIVQFIYNFVDEYRKSPQTYHSAIVIFRGPEIIDEKMFDVFLWQRLQSFSAIDAINHVYDKRVDSDVESGNFSFSMKEEAFFILGMHPGNSRPARQTKYPALVFNPHDQFEKLKHADKYETLKSTIRKRDQIYSGSVNPMLEDFGKSPEVFQYSGQNYGKDWKCPLKIQRNESKHDSAA